MGKSCVDLYLDKDGKRSNLYYSIKAKYGEEAAKAAYIDSMLYDKEVLFSEGLEGQLSMSAITKELRKDIKETVSPSTILKESSAGPTDNQVSWSALIQAAKDKGYEYNKNKKDNDPAIDFKESLLLAKKHFGMSENMFLLDPGSNIEEFNNYKTDINNLWLSQNLSGTASHNFIEEVLNIRNLQPQNEKRDWISPYVQDAIDTVRSKNKDNNKYLTGTVAAQLQTIIQGQLMVYKKDLEDRYGKEFEIFTEEELVSPDVLYKGKPIGGVADIVLRAKDGDMVIIDTKTKSFSSWAKYEKQYGNMKGEFSSLENSAANRTALQLNIYKAAAEASYGGNVLELKILPIVGNFRANPNQAPGEKDWILDDINTEESKLIDPPNVEGAVASVLNIKKSSGLSNRSSHEVIDELFDGKLDTVSSSETSFINKQLTNIKTSKNGRKTWVNPFTNEVFEKNSDKEIEPEMKAAYADYIEMKKNGVKSLKVYFETGAAPDNSIWTQESYKAKAINILRGINKNTHEFFTSNDFEELKDIGDDVFLLKDKISNEISIISLAAAYNKSYYFHEEGDPLIASTIYGNYITDGTANINYGIDTAPKADIHNMSLLRLSLIAADLKTRNPKKYGKVEKILSIALLESDNQPYIYSSLKTQLGILKEFSSIIKESGKTVPSEITTIINSKKLNDYTGYQQDYLDRFFEIVKKIEDPLKKYEKFGSAASKRARNVVRDLMYLYDQGKLDTVAQHELELAMENYLKQTFWAIWHKQNVNDPDDVYQDPEFKLVNRAYLSLKGIMIYDNPIYKAGVLSSLDTLNTAGDPYAQAAHRMISLHEQRGREELIEFIDEHSRLQEAVIKKTIGVNTITRMLSIDQYKEVFGPMLEDHYEFQHDNVAMWMKFKDPNDSTLNAEQKEYIEFFNEHVRKAAKKLFRSSIKMMYPEEIQRTNAIKKWEEGYIPLISSSATQVFQETMSLRSGSNFAMKLFDKIRNSATKQAATGKPGAVEPWSFTSMFLDQVDNKVGRGSVKTRDLLRITEDNSVLDDNRNIELNPAAVLNLMMIESVRKQHIEPMALVSSSIDAELAAKNLFPGVDSKELRDLIHDVTELRVHNRVRAEEGQFGKFVDTTKKSAAMIAFFGAIRQMSTEFSTATSQTASSVFAMTFMKFLFKRDTKYNVKDLKWALSKTETSFAHQLMVDFGLYNTNLGQFTASDYIGTRKKGLFQSKHGFAPIHMILKTAVQNVVLAQMHKDGLTEKAYELNKKTGKYEYREERDNRFYVYDPDLDIEGKKSKPPQNKEDERKWFYWKAHRKKLIKEGAIKGNRITRPFIVNHLQAMKHYAVKLYGAMDNSEAIAAETSAIGRAVLVFTKWLRQKADNWVAPTELSLKEGKWIEIIGEDGKIESMDFMEQEFEGYIASIKGLWSDIKRYGINVQGVGKAIDGSSDIRIENLSKLLGDLIVSALIFITAFGLKELIKSLAEKYKEKYKTDEDANFLDAPLKMFKKELFGKESILLAEINKGLNNALSDVFPFAAFAGLLENGPAAGLSMMYNLSSKTVQALFYAITGDLEKATYATEKVFNSSGFYRTGKGVTQLLVQ